MPFRARMMNGKSEDSALYVEVQNWHSTLLFDCGQNRLPFGELLRLSDVFLSHMHMDHWIGFDHLLRPHLNVPQPKTLRIHGPQGTVDKVYHKLQGYTWNLTQDSVFSIEAREVLPDGIRSRTFACNRAFEPDSEARMEPATDVLLDTPFFTVRCAILDHGIPCLAFSLEEKTRFRVDREALDRLGLPEGPWLARFKDRVQAGAPDSEEVDAEGRKAHLGELKRQLIQVVPGHKLAYVTDTIYNDETVARAVALARGADHFICEAVFLEEDARLAEQNFHMTARQAGMVARAAGVRRMEIVHHSRRYRGKDAQFLAEVRAEFPNVC